MREEAGSNRSMLQNRFIEILKNGDNVLTVEVANTWSNRLTGDAVTGQNYTNTNISTTIVPGLDKIYIPWKEVPLIRSGLFGPVKLFTLKDISPTE